MPEQEPPRAPDNETPDSAESEARDAIAAFEEILDVFPTDVGTLDALAQSYHLIGETDKERTYLKRLIQALLEQGDIEAAGGHVGRLESVKGDDAEADAIIEQMRAMGVSEIPADAGDAAETTADETALGDRGSATDAEMELAWTLREAEVLSEDEYGDIVKDLTELSTQNTDVTLSVLHALQDRTSRTLDPVLAYIMRESRAPPAPLDCIEPDEDILLILPLNIMITHGLAVFDRVGKEFLVATMNPLRKGLREALSRRLGQRCHLFAAHPVTFDSWVGRIQQQLKDRGNT